MNFTVMMFFVCFCFTTISLQCLYCRLCRKGIVSVKHHFDRCIGHLIVGFDWLTLVRVKAAASFLFKSSRCG